MFAAIETQGKARDWRLTVALLLAVAVWPGIAHPEDPPRIEVFTSHAFPVNQREHNPKNNARGYLERSPKSHRIKTSVP